jgi:hypothetical protein
MPLLTLPGHESGKKWGTGCECQGCRAERCRRDAIRKMAKKVKTSQPAMAMVSGSFYIVMNPNTGNIKFGITDRPIAIRLSVHERDGYTLIVKTYRNLPGTMARDVERVAIAELRLRGMAPVRGKEYYESSTLSYVIELADRWIPEIHHRNSRSYSNAIRIAETSARHKAQPKPEPKQQPFATKTSDDTPLTLREMCEAGIIPVRWSAAKRARSRAGEAFPVGVTTPIGTAYEAGPVRAFFGAHARKG